MYVRWKGSYGEDWHKYGVFSNIDDVITHVKFLMGNPNFFAFEEISIMIEEDEKKSE